MKSVVIRPELISDKETTGEAIQRLFTPKLLAKIDAAGADMAAGNYVTLEELDARLAATRAEWLAANPS